MTATVVKTIGSTGDYSTIALWEAGSPADLTTADQIWQGQLQNQKHTQTATVTIGGTTTDATRYAELTVVPGGSFRDNAGIATQPLRYDASKGAAIECTTGFLTRLINLDQPFCRLSNWQVLSTGGYTAVVDTPNSNRYGQVWDNLIIESTGAHNQTIAHSFGDTSFHNKIRNCLIVYRGSSIGVAVLDASNYCELTNLTVVGTSGHTGNFCWRAQYGSNTAKNCVFMGCTTLATGSGTKTYTTCFSDVISGSGVTLATYDTTLFNSITDGTHDYRIPTGSSLKDVGTTDSTNAANDIYGTARPQGSAYDVGAWEFPAAAFQSYFAGAANSAISDGARAA